MKKVLLSFAVVTCSLVLYSFSPVNSKVAYNDLSEETLYNADLELGSFQEFEETRYTTDKTEWQRRRKDWTDVVVNSTEGTATLSAMETIINNN